MIPVTTATTDDATICKAVSLAIYAKLGSNTAVSFTGLVTLNSASTRGVVGYEGGELVYLLYTGGHSSAYKVSSNRNGKGYYVSMSNGSAGSFT